jgi:Ca-activated chloride channel homolog
MKNLFICLIFLSLSMQLAAQSGRKDIRQGNRHFKNEKFEDSETAYRKALEGKKVDNIAEFNLGDALYRQKKYEEAGHQFEAAASIEAAKTNSAKAYHNLGNSFLQAGKIDESIAAYKNALRKNPKDLDTKYNLTYAQRLKKQQDQQKQQQGDNKNQDNKDQKQNKDQNNKDGDKKDQQQQDQQQKDQQQQQGQQGQEDQKDQNTDKQQAKTQNVKISKEDAERLLEALANDEKKVQDKVKKEKASASKVRTIKDW